MGNARIPTVMPSLQRYSSTPTKGKRPKYKVHGGVLVALRSTAIKVEPLTEGALLHHP